MDGGLHQLTYPWWRELTVKQPRSSKGFVPSIDVLAKTVLVLRLTPGLKPAHIRIVEFLVATAQRIDQVCSLERSQVETNEDGSGVIHWTSRQMKSGLPHALWAPAEVLAFIAPKGQYAFPANESGDRPVRSSVINRWLGNLWGRKSAPGREHYEGKPGPAPGTGSLPPVLKEAGIPFWTPHAVRSVLATELIDAMLDAAASAILSHKRPRTTDLPERPSEESRAEEVTLRHYSRAQRPPLKKLGMQEWSRRFAEAEKRVLLKE
jgi:integrase